MILKQHDQVEKNKVLKSRGDASELRGPEVYSFR
jgi:hypothetical protein